MSQEEGASPTTSTASLGGLVPSSVFGSSRGTVTGYDDHVGAGVVTGDDGQTWWFHCTRIADGSRSVPVGAVVSFVLSAGPNGIEAIEVAPSS